MASPRPSSPAAAGYTSAPTSPQLTPRSKLKALLAAVDDGSSDEDSGNPIDAKSLFASIDQRKQKRSVEQASQHDSADETDGHSDEDTEIVRPRGRLAARMHANFTTDNQIPESETSTTKPASRDATPRSTPSRNKTPEVSPSEEERDNEDDDDDDIVAPSRRKQTRPERASTPETTIQAAQHSSPGLFVSPSPSKSPSRSGSAAVSDSDEDDIPADLSKNARFKALVEKKRKERLAKEAEEERKRLDRAQRASNLESDADEDDVSDISDDDGGRKLTQDVSRPARKASKKALEEINRETQRLSRSLQLAHEAKTKKKISKATLFKRFNFQTEGAAAQVTSNNTSSSRPTTPGSIHQTDIEQQDSETPPSSPPTVPKMASDLPITDVSVSEVTPLAVGEEGLAQSKKHSKSTVTSVDIAHPVTEIKQALRKPLRQVRVKLPVQAHTAMIDFDDELEITKPTQKDKLDTVFSRIPESKKQESTGMKILRNLAHLSSPLKEPASGRNVKSSMSLGELHMSLQQRAKAQAKLERERRLEVLRSKGIVVQSAEEREREREQVEDIVARARQEVEEIMLREREEAKKTRKENKENGEADPLAWDDSDDDSFQDGEDDEPRNVDLSGSEEEQQDDNDEEDDDEDRALNNPMLIDEAEESEPEDATPKPVSDDFSDEDVEAMKRPSALQLRRSKKQKQIISDDEDEDEVRIDVKATPKTKSTFPKSPYAPGSGSPKLPTSVLRSATKNFIPGIPIPVAAPAGLGLTQMFAGTMDNSQANHCSPSLQDVMPSIDMFPDSQFSATAGQSQGGDMVRDSQPTPTRATQGYETQTQGIQLHYSQSQAHGFDSLVQPDATEMFDFLEPTQDLGFQDYTPLKQRFVDPPTSTVDTIPLAGAEDEAIIAESPLVRKRGKLIRRTEFSAPSPTLPSTHNPEVSEPIPATAAGASPEGKGASDAFRLMERAAKRERRLKKRFDRKKSKATEMIEEQAEESEDEYAGLGGADGEDSSDEDEELVKEMIDDTKGNDADAAKLAGLFADRERAADAAQVDKLFRDITTGMLRKRRRGGDGHDFDLSDSDDGGEARRRMKRRQFAKMQKALFADERIGKIAENPRNAAFLKSIEDLDHGEEWDFGENFAADATSTSGDDSQSQNANQADQAIPDSQPPALGRKRSRGDDHAARPGPSERRRIREGARPSSIAEVRRSLSTLLDEPNASTGSVIPATEPGSDSDGDEQRLSTSPSNKENRRRTRHTGGAFVDRIALKRNSSSSLSTGGTSASTKLAFTATSTTSSGFKVPALLRRATTNSTKLLSSNPNSTTSSSTSSTTMGHASAGRGSGSLNKAASFGDDGKLKKTAGKRSGINYFAHENERRARVADAEKRREAKKWKGAEGRSKAVGSLFGRGSFE
ncbi:MRC1-like domain-containing protein [Nemania sp. FL0916]|nr:MRC1-like domain-containing protein [Nemania sp. FL0916]